MKKKLLALMLVMAMVLGMSTTAMAAVEGETESTEETYHTFKKVYNVKGATGDEFVYPAETLKFTISSEDADAPTLAIKNSTLQTETIDEVVYKYYPVSVPSGLDEDGFEIEFEVKGDITKAGTFTYTIKELEGTTKGVTYDTNSTITVQVLVNSKLQVEKFGVKNAAQSPNKVKNDTFTNELKLKKFTVEKQVTGNMSVATDAFDITVTLTSDKPVLSPILVNGVKVESSAWVPDGDKFVYTNVGTYSDSMNAVTFANIPEGVMVTVDETLTDAQKKLEYTYISGEKLTAEEVNGQEFVIINDKSSTIDTGIFTNNLPYIVALLVVALAAVAFMRRRREF